MQHRRILLALVLALFAPGAAAAQQRADTVTAGVRLGFATLPLPVPLDLRLDLPRLLPPPVTFDDYVAGWVQRVNDDLAARRMRMLGRRFAARAATATPAVPLAADSAPPGFLSGTLARYADIGMRVTGTGELGGAWQRYEPCDPGQRLNCNPSLFPRLRPDVQFGVQVTGTISDRIHVNVDYDQRREDFTASNTINVWYEGQPGEMLQSVQVGDVSLRLPSSRYLTRSVPAGNFGVTATGEVGPLTLQTVFAQQRGDVTTSEFRLAGTGTQGLVQDEELALDDADYVEGQFFFLVDPATIAGAPLVDVLQLVAGDAPASVRPGLDAALELYRDERIAATSTQQAQLGIFLADAVAPDGSLQHTGLFRRLVPGEDYIVHSSGLWIALRSPLRPDEALAVSYVTETGDTIGTIGAEQRPPGQPPELRLLRSPAASHQPGSATWDYELHNIYRINASGGVDPSSIAVTVSLGDAAAGLTFKQGPGGQVTFLRLFGLDDDAPADVVDDANIWQPARDDFATGTRPPVNGTFLVFPSLEPFQRPPAVPSAGLDAEGARALLGADANAEIYEAIDPVIRAGAGRFRLTFRYRVQVEGLVSTFSLGQFGIREGTERLTIGDVELTRGTDYTIDYELGIVTLTDPQSLFGLDPDAEIRATWEQRTLFEVAPTSVFGAAATYHLGAAGTLDFVGIYQSEKTLYTRPQLGVEPSSALLGGASANLRVGAGFLDRLLDAIPGLRLDGESSVRINGEVALAAPNPNRRGAAFLDDFEATDEVSIDLRRQQWRLGSRPGTTEGDMGVLPDVLDVTSAAPLVWQHDIAQGGAVSGTLLPTRDIDRQINIAGNAVPETAMWLTFGSPDTPPGERRWRSMTTVLSTTGQDMSRSEFLEFYASASGPAPLALVIDIGTTGEDAFYFDPAGNTTGSYSDGRTWGLGILDEEARLADREIWGPDSDARGLWDQPCAADPLQAYPLGDPRSNCTRGNGLPDTEDLDGNGILQPDDGAHFRYVVALDETSPFLVRDTMETGTSFRLFRIPLRDGAPVNGATEATWRFIRHLRLTLAGEPGGTRNLVLARVRVIGSRWTKRDVHGVMSGLLDDRPGAGSSSTQVRVGPVSQVTDGPAYSSPPGVRDQLQDPSTQFGGSGIEFNEKSLRIRYEGLLPGERAETYLRYPQQPRNFMNYRQLRLWALPRAGHWGRADGERLVIRVGTDARNFYLFQTQLHPATGDRMSTPDDWLPEVVIDFNRWFDLKAEAERRLLERAPGMTVDTVWSADSAYAVVLEDRARAPNLASVRELSFAVYNAGAVVTDGEVWIDEMRLTEPLTDPGAAGNLTLTLDGDFLDASIGYANQGSLFRQLGELPGYRSTGDLAVNATARLDRFLPAEWGLDVPLTVSHSRADIRPEFLEQSDVRADRLPELRETGAGQTRVALRIDKRSESTSTLGRVLLDPVTLRVGFNRAHTNTTTSRAQASGVDGGIDYLYDMGRRAFGIVPGFLADALRAIAPAAIEESEAFQRLVDAQLRWTPARIGFGVSYWDREDRAYRFDRILAVASDTLVRPIESPRRGLENRAELSLAPFEPLTAAFTMRSSRDLLEPERATTRQFERNALHGARRTLFGIPVGWESDRTFGTNLAFRPRITDWLRASWTWDNRYGTRRSPAFLELLDAGEDTVASLQRRFGSDRQVGRRVDFQPNRMLRAWIGPRADSLGGMGGALFQLGDALESISVTWNGGVSSQFERANIEPGFGYRFGFGDLSSFRFVDGDTAAQALEREDLRLQTAVALPLDANFTVGYLRTNSHGFDLRGGERTAETTGWPNLRFGWRRLPLPGFMTNLVTGASLSAGWEHSERTNLYGASSQNRVSIEDRYPLEMSLALARGITATYSGSIAIGESTDPTGRAEQDRTNHSLRFAGSLAPPQFLQPRITQPINLSLLLSHDGQQQCRFRLQSGQAGTCVAYLDNVTRTINFTIDTMMSDLLVGLRGSWTDRQSRVGTRTGSSQFQLALYGQFLFQAGELAR